jgi:hypothetical protein
MIDFQYDVIVMNAGFCGWSGWIDVGHDDTAGPTAQPQPSSRVGR